jgi:hypothetical protein
MVDPTVDTTPATTENTDCLAQLAFSPLPGVADLKAGRWRAQCGQQHIALIIADTIVQKTPEELATYLTQMQALHQHPAASEMMAAYSDNVGRAFRLMSATCFDRSRPAIPIDVGRGGRAPAGRM